ncbi:MAG: hypothetical protein ACO1SX_27955 [Actinomycetota bacterium]
MSNFRVRELSGLRAIPASEPAESDLQLINSAYAQAPVTGEDIHVRQARVAHNQHDRTLERFPKAMLERFAETLPGKSLLPGHDTSAMPLGRWFRADTRTRTEDFPVVAQGKAKAAEIVPGFVAQKTRVTWLEAAFYWVKDPGTELFRKNIDTGVYQDVSIGFSYDDVDCDVCKKSYWRSPCPHYAGQKLDDGTVVTLTYSGDPKLYEARETSIVYLGAQQQAELTKQLKEGCVDPERLARTAYGTDMVALKGYEALARQRGHQVKSWAFPALKVSPPIDGEVPEDDKSADGAIATPALSKEIEMLDQIRKLFSLADTATEDDAVKAVEQAKDAAKRAADAESAKATAEAESAKLKPLATIGETALADLQKQYVDHCLKLDRNEVEAKALAEMFAEKQDYPRLKSLVESTFAEVCAKFPAAPSAHVAHATGNGEAPPPAAAPVRATEFMFV